MTQILLPEFPEGAERINPMLSILRHDKQVTYFVGDDNYFSHAEDDAAGRQDRPAHQLQKQDGTPVRCRNPPQR